MKEAIAERRAARFVQGAAHGSAMLGERGEDRGVGDVVVVEQVGTVAADDAPRRLAGLGQAVDEHAGGGRVQGDHRLVDADHGCPAPAAAHALEQRDEAPSARSVRRTCRRPGTAADAARRAPPDERRR